MQAVERKPPRDRTRKMLPKDWLNERSLEELTWVGKAVAELRRHAGISQDELAKRCRWRHDHIYRIERVRHVPRMDTLCRVAHALEMSVFDLFLYANFLRENYDQRVKRALEHAALFTAEEDQEHHHEGNGSRL